MFYFEYPVFAHLETVQVAWHLNVNQARKMRYLITLNLPPPNNSLEYVKQLDGIKDLEIDEDYGLVLISPKRDLYVIRVSGDIDSQKLMTIQPLVKGVHGDLKIAPTESQEEEDK
jgi:hypothetical protein